MTDIFTLGIKADTTDIDRGTKSLDNIANASDRAEKSTIKLRKGINEAGLAITAFGVAGAVALGAITVSAGSAAKEIENLSRLSNLSAEEFQRSAFAAKAFGVEQDKLSDIFKDTQDKIGDFLSEGGGELAHFFDEIAPKIGVTAEMFRGLSGKEGLQLYVDTLEKANPSQSEMVTHLERIASDATLLQPLLADGGKEFERLGKRADELNVILSEFDISSLQDMNTALREMGAISDATGNVIGATLAPFVTDLTARFNDATLSGDVLRDTVLDIAGAGVAVAGVFADAGRVFEIFGVTIAAAIFETVQSFDTLDARLDLSLAGYQLFGEEMGLATTEWVNELIKEVVDGINGVTEALNVLGIFDSAMIEAPQIDTSGFEDSIADLESEMLGLEQSLEQSNKNIADAWLDVTDLLMQPLPSEGFDNWFKAIRASVNEIKTLQGETTKLEKQTRNSKIGTVAIDWEKQFKKSGETMGALNTIFGGNEKAAKALHAVNQGIALAEAVMSIQKITQGSTEAAVHVANEGAKSSANALTAITSAFSTSPVWVGLAAGAAMIGVMSSLGVFGGGGSAVVDPTAERQDTQGTGTVFGSDDKSASISNAQARFEDIAIDQLAELRGIRNSINSLSSGIEQLSNTISGSQSFGEFSGRTGVTSSSLGGLFSKTTKTVIDEGISFVSQSLGQIIETGIVQAQQFFTVKTKKKGLFGLTSSTRSGDEFQNLDSIIQEQMADIFENIGSTVVEAAGLLGFETATVVKRVFGDIGSITDSEFGGFGDRVVGGFEDTLKAIELPLEDALKEFSVDIGRISLEGLSGEEIQNELTAIFSQQADLIAEFLVPSIAEYQKVGEGLFDTLLRVTEQQVIFNDTINQMGFDLSDLSSVMQIDIAQSIIDLIGGAERFSDLTSEFFSEFFSESEQFEQLTMSITEALDGLGLSMFDTREQFRDAIEALDLTTEAGQAMFASLLELVPAMDSFFDSVEADELEALADAERELADIRREEQAAARDLERELSAEKREEDATARDLAREAAKTEREEQAAIRLLERQAASEANEAAKIATQLANELLRLEEERAKQVSFFVSQFLTDSQQFELATNELTNSLSGLGLSMFESRASLIDYIGNIDNADSSLLALLPQLDAYFDAIESAAEQGALSELAKQQEELAASERLLEEQQKASEDQQRELAEQQREAAQAAAELADAIARLTTELTDAAKTSLSKLAESIGVAQGDMKNALSETLSGIATDFESQRQSIFERTASQVSSMEMQLGLVNDRVSDLAGLSGILSSSLSNLAGTTRGKARADIQSAIAAGNAGQDLAGLGLEGAVSALANIEQSSFGNALELRLEQARTARELGELKSLTDDQLNQGEINAKLIEQQISTIENSSEMQIATLFELQESAEQLAQENSDKQISALNDILTNAEDELNAMLGVETGVLSLVGAQDRFRESIDALATQITEQAAQASEQAAQAQEGQAAANAAAVEAVDNSTSNAALVSIANNSRKTNTLLNRWDTDGQPEVRSAS